jgi:hypothetical protein
MKPINGNGAKAENILQPLAAMAWRGEMTIGIGNESIIGQAMTVSDLDISNGVWRQ